MDHRRPLGFRLSPTFSLLVVIVIVVDAVIVQPDIEYALVIQLRASRNFYNLEDFFALSKKVSLSVISSTPQKNGNEGNIFYRLTSLFLTKLERWWIR